MRRRQHEFGQQAAEQQHTTSDACTMCMMTAGVILPLSPRDACRVGDLRSSEVMEESAGCSITPSANFAFCSTGTVARLIIVPFSAIPA